MQAAGLPAYEKPPAKSWDALRACDFILARAARTRPVLDVGGVPGYSHISTWLARLGFAVDVINPAFERDVVDPDGGIRWLRGDATATSFPDERFAAVTCLSVIEHGVELDPFFAEMRRIVIPGGHLVISTDFWPEPIDTGDRRAFGAPVTIFTRQGIERIVASATEHGFQPTGLIDYRCEERTVQWLGLEYTFIDLALRRVE